jgi:hypothetical protein
MPPPRSLTNSGVAKFHGSEDWIELALYVKWGPSWRDTVRLFEECKAEAAAEESETGGFFDLGGWSCEVLPTGAKSSGGGPYRAFVVLAVGLRFEFGRSDCPKGDTPNGKLVATSLTCMKLGAAGVLALATEFIEALGGEIVGNKVSRIDGAVDCPGIDVGEFVRPFMAGHVLCRADRDSIHRNHRRIETLRVGKDLSVRIYDKLAELRDVPNEEKEAFLVKERWDGVVPPAASRVEFQLRRKGIKSMCAGDGFQIDSLEDYLACREGMWAYMCQWFRLTTEEVDPNHRDRATTLPLWADVSKAFAAWSSSEIKSITRAKRLRALDNERLNLQITGCVLSQLAVGSKTFNGKADLIRAAILLMDDTADALGEEELLRRWLKKRRQNEARNVPEHDRRPKQRPRFYPFNLWIKELEAKKEAIVAAGGQVPLTFSSDGDLPFLDLETYLPTVVGD